MVLEDSLVLEHIPPTGRYSIVEMNAKDKWLLLGRKKVPTRFWWENV